MSRTVALTLVAQGEHLGRYLVDTNALSWADIVGLFGLHGLNPVALRVTTQSFASIGREANWPFFLDEIEVTREEVAPSLVEITLEHREQ
jgi:hypothetical protein